MYHLVSVVSLGRALQFIPKRGSPLVQIAKDCLEWLEVASFFNLFIFSGELQ